MQADNIDQIRICQFTEKPYADTICIVYNMSIMIYIFTTAQFNTN